MRFLVPLLFLFSLFLTSSFPLVSSAPRSNYANNDRTTAFIGSYGPAVAVYPVLDTSSSGFLSRSVPLPGAIYAEFRLNSLLNSVCESDLLYATFRADKFADLSPRGRLYPEDDIELTATTGLCIGRIVWKYATNELVISSSDLLECKRQYRCASNKPSKATKDIVLKVANRRVWTAAELNKMTKTDRYVDAAEDRTGNIQRRFPQESNEAELDSAEEDPQEESELEPTQDIVNTAKKRARRSSTPVNVHVNVQMN
jgi:hypothetical protein